MDKMGVAILSQILSLFLDSNLFFKEPVYYLQLNTWGVDEYKV